MRSPCPRYRCQRRRQRGAGPYFFPIHSNALLTMSRLLLLSHQVCLYPHDISSTDHSAGDEQYQRALTLLSSLPSAKTLQKAAAESSRPKSLLASLFPNHEGPIATAIRILAKIEQELSFLPLRIFKSLNFRRLNPNVREKASNQATSAVVLLEDASGQGHLEALYQLGMISLVGSIVSLRITLICVVPTARSIDERYQSIPRA